MSTRDETASPTLVYAAIDVRSLTAVDRFVLAPFSWRLVIGLPLLACLPVLLIAHADGGIFDPQSYYMLWPALGMVSLVGATLLALAYFALRASVVRRLGLKFEDLRSRSITPVMSAFLLFALPTLTAMGACPWLAFQIYRPQFDSLRTQAVQGGGTFNFSGYVGPFNVKAIYIEEGGKAVVIDLHGASLIKGSGFVWTTDGAMPGYNYGDDWPLFGGWHTFSTD